MMGRKKTFFSKRKEQRSKNKEKRVKKPRLNIGVSVLYGFA
jgi:hypothetical protein